MMIQCVPVSVLQRWSILSGSRDRSDAEDHELLVLIKTLKAAGLQPAAPCRRRGGKEAPEEDEPVIEPKEESSSTFLGRLRALH